MVGNVTLFWGDSTVVGSVSCASWNSVSRFYQMGTTMGVVGRIGSTVTECKNSSVKPHIQYIFQVKVPQNLIEYKTSHHL